MLRSIIIFFTLNLIPISVFAQCTADAQLISQSVGTIYLSGMSTISSGISSNNSLSYEWDFRMVQLPISRTLVILMGIYPQ